MKQKEFEQELKARFRENKRLVERQFLPEFSFGLASFLVQRMFHVLVVVSFLITLVFFELWGRGFLTISRALLLL